MSLVGFVDCCPELNHENDSVRRRSVLLISKLFKDESIDLDAKCAEIFFDYFIRRLNDFPIADEIAKTLQVLINRYPSLVDVIVVRIL